MKYCVQPQRCQKNARACPHLSADLEIPVIGREENVAEQDMSDPQRHCFGFAGVMSTAWRWVPEHLLITIAANPQLRALDDHARPAKQAHASP